MSSTLKEFLAGRRLPVVMQAASAECGLACVTMISRYHGHEIDLAAMRRRFSVSLKGTSFTRLMEIADALGFGSRALRAELHYLQNAKLPCVLHWNMNHFVVLKRITKRYAVVHDPAIGAVTLSIDELGARFTGYLLEFVPRPDFAAERDQQRLGLRQMLGSARGLRRSFAQIVMLTLAIELMAVLLPLQTQITLDHVLASHDNRLLAAIAIAFALIAMVQAALSAARGCLVGWLGADLSAQWINNIFAHVLKLPVDFVRSRHLGDIVSRFGSVKSVQATFTASFIEASIDGLFGTLTLIVLFMYSATLVLPVLAACALFAAMTPISYKKMRKIAEERMTFSAAQQSELLESIRAAETIKLANKFPERSARLANATFAANLREMRSQYVSATYNAASRGLFALQRVGLIVLAAHQTMSGAISAGMMVTFVMLAEHFTGKFAGLIDRFVEFKMLSVHLTRISDLVLAEPEAHLEGDYLGPPQDSAIAFERVGFRYAEGEPWVLHDVSFTVQPGESVAIVGPSGCGKTTLAKLLLGLLQPTEGRITFGGIDIRKLGLRNYRDRIAAVLQEDHLFAGSVAANISFFDPDASLEAIVDAAKAASIHDDILALPMGYESMVGDMGSSLSGGQKQRVLIARALYRATPVMLFDEATSHLDIAAERVVLDNLRIQTRTRILIAHRPETIAACDRKIDMGGWREGGRGAAASSSRIGLVAPGAKGNQPSIIRG